MHLRVLIFLYSNIYNFAHKHNILVWDLTRMRLYMLWSTNYVQDKVKHLPQRVELGEGEKKEKNNPWLLLLWMRLSLGQVE